MTKNPWFRIASGILVFGFLILGPAALHREIKSVRTMVANLYRDMRTDEHIIASMRHQLEDQHRQIARLDVQNRRIDVQIQSAKKRISSDEARLQLLRNELSTTELHLRSPHDEFQVRDTVISREELSQHAENCLGEAASLEERLAVRREGIAKLEEARADLKSQLEEARAASTASVRNLDSQVARLETAEAHLQVARLLDEMNRPTASSSQSLIADQQLIEERIQITTSEAERLRDGGRSAGNLVFQRAPENVVNRISEFLGRPEIDPDLNAGHGAGGDLGLEAAAALVAE